MMCRLLLLWLLRVMWLLWVFVILCVSVRFRLVLFWLVFLVLGLECLVE